MIRRLMRRVRIDWSGFAVTHGGFFDGFGYLLTPVEPRYIDPSRVLVASGGFYAGLPPVPPGVSWACHDGWRWHPWRAWYPPPGRLEDSLPAVRAPRGGIRFAGPPSG